MLIGLLRCAVSISPCLNIFMRFSDGEVTLLIWTAKASKLRVSLTFDCSLVWCPKLTSVRIFANAPCCREDSFAPLTRTSYDSFCSEGDGGLRCLSLSCLPLLKYIQPAHCYRMSLKKVFQSENSDFFFRTLGCKSSRTQKATGNVRILGRKSVSIQISP